MAVRSTNTMSEGLARLVQQISALKLTPDVDLDFLGSLESNVIEYARQTAQQSAMQQQAGQQQAGLQQAGQMAGMQQMGPAGMPGGGPSGGVTPEGVLPMGSTPTPPGGGAAGPPQMFGPTGQVPPGDLMALLGGR